MAMTLQQIRDYVRDHMDLEEDDLPNHVLDTFIREGSRRIERADAHWPFYQAITTFTLSPEQGRIKLAEVADDLDKLVLLKRGDDQLLRYVGVRELMQLRETRRSRPTYWTQWGDTLIFWPTPDTEAEIQLLYYRRPHDWVADGAGGVPDMPEELHEAIASWALAHAYAQQEDPEMAALYIQKWQDQLTTFKRTINEMPLEQPIVLNGGGVIRWMDLQVNLDWM